MYKGASQNLVHRHAVDRPLPTGGYIGSAEPDQGDLLPDPAQMTTEQLRGELEQLRREIILCDQQLQAAKANGETFRREAIGSRRNVLQERIAVIKRALKAIDGEGDLSRLKRAINEIVGHETADRIFERARAMRGELPVGEQG